MRDSKRTPTAPQQIPPLTPDERAAQLRQIADRTLYRIQRGYCSERERTELLRQYDLIDKILMRHNAGQEPESPILRALLELEREDRETGENYHS